MKDRDVILAIGGAFVVYLIMLVRKKGITPELPEGRPGVSPPVMTPLQAKVMAYRDIIMAESKQGVPPAMIAAVIAAESSGDPSAKTWEPKVNEYSYGLMQVLGSTALWLCDEKGITYGGRCKTLDELLDPAANIRYGTAYLRFQLVQNSFDPDKTFAAYNAGSARYNLLGRFVNQSHVDKCTAFREQFRPLFEFYYPGQV